MSQKNRRTIKLKCKTDLTIEHLDTGVSPASTVSAASKSSLGGRSSKQRKMKNRKLKARANLRQQFKDTNTIYPPNQAYNDANNELKSPAKKRPQSGGPAPDKL